MGRRALPKINSDIDLEGQLLTFEELPEPWSPAALFGREAPFEVEVGSGKGLFLQHATAAHPERNYLGIEVAKKYARFAASKLARRGLDNGCLLAGDGLRFFREVLQDATVDDVHVYFPDPWWKKRHRRRRVLNEPFLSDVVRTLKPGGRLHFWTDVQEYFETSLDLIAEVTPLEGPQPVPEASAEHDLDYRTHFERRTRMMGLPVYRSLFLKPGA